MGPALASRAPHFPREESHERSFHDFGRKAKAFLSQNVDCPDLCGILDHSLVDMLNKPPLALLKPPQGGSKKALFFKIRISEQPQKVHRTVWAASALVPLSAKWAIVSTVCLELPQFSAITATSASCETSMGSASRKVLVRCSKRSCICSTRNECEFRVNENHPTTNHPALVVPLSHHTNPLAFHKLRGSGLPAPTATATFAGATATGAAAAGAWRRGSVGVLFIKVRRSKHLKITETHRRFQQMRVCRTRTPTC